MRFFLADRIAPTNLVNDRSASAARDTWHVSDSKEEALGGKDASETTLELEVNAPADKCDPDDATERPDDVPEDATSDEPVAWGLYGAARMR